MENVTSDEENKWFDAKLAAYKREQVEKDSDMNKIIDVIRFEGKNYMDADVEEKQEIEKLASKLASLANEITNDKKGSITIRKSGNLIIDSFQPELAKKISALTR